jgi:subtilase family serine protease
VENPLRRALLVATMCSAFAGQAAFAAVTRAEPSRPVAFDVMLPLHDTAGLKSLLAQLHNPASPQFHHWLTPAQFGERFGPDAAIINRVANALRTRGFNVEAHTRSLHVSGPAALTEAALGTHLMVAPADAGHMHIVADGELHLPAEVTEAGGDVLSFSSHVAHTFSHSVTPVGDAVVNARSGSTIGPYWFDDLKQAYAYPSVQATVQVNGNAQPLDGTGATIGILMSSDVYDSDIKAMFDQEKWSTVSGTPDPVLYKRVTIDGGGGLNPKGALGEASLDVQQALGGAPGAHVVLYNIPNLSDDNIMTGYTTIIDQNIVDAVSSSFGECELFYFPKYNNGKDYRKVLKAYNELFQQGNAQGISFLASSGDEAGLECPTLPYLNGGSGHFVASVSSPADDPNVTAVGGTNLVTVATKGSLDSTYASENAWSDPEIPYDPYQIGNGAEAKGGVWGAGGGYSAMWAQPSYQSALPTGSTKWRAVPDIGMQVGGCPGVISKLTKKNPHCNGLDKAKDGSGNSDRSAVWVYVGGKIDGLIGTSVSSPELLSAVAILVGSRGNRMGNLNEYIYSLAGGQAGGAPAFFHTGIPGYNGVENTLLAPSYSLSTGVGTPIVNSFILQPTAPVAGIPQTSSNP